MAKQLIPGSNAIVIEEDGTVKIAGSTLSGGASAFTALTDAPASYSGEGGKYVRVNAGASGLEFITLSGGGDMAKATYDPNDDGVIAAAQLDTSLATTANIATHAALTTGVHGAGTGLIAYAIDVANHAAVTTGIHGVGTSLIASTANITAAVSTHGGLSASHGAGTIAGLADIVTHSGLTALIHGIAAGSTIATTAEIATHSAATAGIHGVAAGSAIATTATIATHANLTTEVHGFGIAVASATSQNASTALADINQMLFAAATASTYIVEGFIVWSVAAATTVGLKLSATGPANATIMAGHIITDSSNGTPDSSSFNADNVVVTTSASPFATNNLAVLQAILKTAGTAGNFQLRYAAETAGTITIQIGSVLRWQKVA